MSGILLICGLIAIYIICYWSILIELKGNKRTGFLRFSPDAGDLCPPKKPVSLYHAPCKNVVSALTPESTPAIQKQKQKKPYLK